MAAVAKLFLQEKNSTESKGLFIDLKLFRNFLKILWLKCLFICGHLINQALNSVLVKLSRKGFDGKLINFLDIFFSFREPNCLVAIVTKVGADFFFKLL